MINITIYRKKTGSIQSFSMSGHALFAEKGQDIVCAGASAVSFGTINAIHELTGVTPKIEQGKDGFLRCSIPESLPESIQEKIQILLEGMVISLESIEEQYGQYITITFKK
nr:ribosomal-processing cysteine protease Prp [uncultured Bacillus sp.]